MSIRRGGVSLWSAEHQNSSWLFALTWVVQTINEPQLFCVLELCGAGQSSGCDQAVQELGH